MTADDPLNQLSLATEHLQQAIEYARRGKKVFFDPVNLDTSRLVESELRKAYEAMNRLGQPFYRANPALPEAEIGRVRQLLTHDYGDVILEEIWRIITEEAPALLRQLTRAKLPKKD
ncbi:MAG: DUF86 domain-containing protein [Thermoplasmata archaeon]|nr:DUF86 domain-containing protein [Thermoplasmata archaeon]